MSKNPIDNPEIQRTWVIIKTNSNLQAWVFGTWRTERSASNVAKAANEYDMGNNYIVVSMESKESLIGEIAMRSIK